LPAEGWSGEAEWTGWVPFEELPHTYDPPEHFIVTANNRPAPATYPHLIGLEWTEPYRAQRITELLRRKAKLTPDDFAAIQADTFSLHADALLPLLLEHVHQQSGPDEQAIAILRGWNRDARGDSGAAAVFQAWLLRLTPAIAGDELGPLVTADYMGLERSSFVARFLARTLTLPDSPWCDDVRTPARETCDDVVLTALHAAVGDLTRQLGSDTTRWRWDAVHRAVFPHQGLDAVALLRPLLSRSIPHGGDWSTVDVGPVVANHPYDQHSIPGYRQIVDLSPPNDSRFLDAVGESGHPLSKQYDDFLADWAAVRHRPMRMDRKDVEAGAIGHLHLLPQRR
jgi:penicillin amidase